MRRPTSGSDDAGAAGCVADEAGSLMDACRLQAGGVALQGLVRASGSVASCQAGGSVGAAIVTFRPWALPDPGVPARVCARGVGWHSPRGVRDPLRVPFGMIDGPVPSGPLFAA